MNTIIPLLIDNECMNVRGRVQPPTRCLFFHHSPVIFASVKASGAQSKLWTGWMLPRETSLLHLGLGLWWLMASAGSARSASDSFYKPFSKSQISRMNPIFYWLILDMFHGILGASHIDNDPIAQHGAFLLMPLFRSHRCWSRMPRLDFFSGALTRSKWSLWGLNA